MYLILHPCEKVFNTIYPSVFDQSQPKTYTSHFTDDITTVEKVLRVNKEAKVYRLDSLSEITDVVATYQEVLKETA